MQHRSIPFREAHSFSNFFLDYIEHKDSLKPFYHHFPVVENFGAQIAEKEKSFPADHRKVLVEALHQQYKNLKLSEKTAFHIESLADQKTFTITTGHQLNIFTGPLYFIYKIVTVVNTCKKLKQAYPGFNFIPVYWMASEDHDYEEIKSFRLYGKKYTWETDQKGAVGRFANKGLDKLMESIPGEIALFKEAYLKQKTLAGAVRYYVNALFSDEGVVVVDADSPDLKKEFIPVMQEDIFKTTPAQKVTATTKQLEGLGYHTQVHARDINFFYLDDQLRGRIEKQGNEFVVIDSAIRFSESEMENLIKQSPEKFSPNVILRPLYQEIILPNLAYVGGPAEVVYWLQLKGVFDHFKVPFPILMPRNFAVVIDAPTQRKLEKTGLEVNDFFEEKNFLFNHWVTQNTKHNLTLSHEMKLVNDLFEEIKQRAAFIDPTLTTLVAAKAKRTTDSLEIIEKKFLKAEKKIHADKLRQIEAVKDALFPNGSLQERTDNFLVFYQQDSQFIKKLIEYFDPFDYRMNVLNY
jgi:bacillithiol biosynthesis cysteine-adding enzyme BshC